MTGLEALDWIRGLASVDFVDPTTGEAALTEVVDGVAIDVEVALVMAHGQEWIVLAAVVGPDDRWEPRAALERTCILAIGALALAAGAYVVRHALPLPRASADDLRFALDAVAAEAALLREIAMAPNLGADVSVFYHLAS